MQSGMWSSPPFSWIKRFIRFAFARQTLVTLASFIGVIVLGNYFVSNLPETYRSKVRFEFIQNQLPVSLLTGDRATLEVDEKNVKRLFLRATTPDNISQFLASTAWGQNPKFISRYGDMDDFVEAIREGLSLDIIQTKVAVTAWGTKVLETVGFDILADSQDPELSAEIARYLVDYLLTNNESLRVQEQTAVLESLKASEKDLINTINNRKAQILSVMDQHEGAIPGQARALRRQYAKTSQRIERYRFQLEQKQLLMSQLDQALSQFSGGQSSSEQVKFLATLLNSQSVQLKSATSRLEQGHPDLVALEQGVKSLESYLVALTGAESSDKVLAEQSLLQSKLERQKTALGPSIAQLNQLISEYEVRLESVGGLLKAESSDFLGKYNQMELDLRVYESELSKLNKEIYQAEYLLDLEKAGKIGRFEPMREVRVPNKAIYPNSSAWLILVLYVALVVAWFAASKTGTASHLIFGRKDLESVVGKDAIFMVPEVN